MKGDDYMATIPTQIRIDATVKDQASRLFADLGMDMSGAVNIFLRQCILHGGLLFRYSSPLQQRNPCRHGRSQEGCRRFLHPQLYNYERFA